MYARITSVGNSVTSIRLLWQLDSCFNKVFIYFLGNEKVSFYLYLFTLSKLNLLTQPGSVSPWGVSVFALQIPLMVPSSRLRLLFSLFCNQPLNYAQCKNNKKKELNIRKGDTGGKNLQPLMH